MGPPPSQIFWGPPKGLPPPGKIPAGAHAPEYKPEPEPEANPLFKITLLFMLQK